MANKPELITVDVRGEICPVPLIKTTEAMRSASDGQDVEMLTDFMPAVLVVTNAALKDGWDVSITIMGTKEWKVVLSRIYNVLD